MTELSSGQKNDALRHHIGKSQGMPWGITADYAWECLKASCVVNGLRHARVFSIDNCSPLGYKYLFLCDMTWSNNPMTSCTVIIEQLFHH